jgi:hypothetical protein
MKKLILLIVLITISACSTNGRVCGGAGGKRCVEVSKKVVSNKIS